MALYPLTHGVVPVGHYDVLDAQAGLLLGGEVMTLVAAPRTNTSTETAAADALDGYDYGVVGQRAAASLASTALQAPLYLSDDGGSPDYLTYFGALTGPTGLGSSLTGAKLGPHTTAGSGKVTLWGTPGMYGVSVDALAADFVSSLAAALAPGAVLGFLNTGKLAHATCAGVVANTGVARFIDFTGSPSLVTTPPKLVGAGEQFTRITIQFDAGLGVRALA